RCGHSSEERRGLPPWLESTTGVIPVARRELTPTPCTRRRRTAPPSAGQRYRRRTSPRPGRRRRATRRPRPESWGRTPARGQQVEHLGGDLRRVAISFVLPVAVNLRVRASRRVAIVPAPPADRLVGLAEKPVRPVVGRRG